MREKAITRATLGIILPLAIIAYLSNISPEDVYLRVCSVVDGKEVCCDITLVDRGGKKTKIKSDGSDAVKLPVGQYQVSVESPGFEEISAIIDVSQSSHQHVNFGVIQQGQMFGRLLNGATLKPITGLEVRMEGKEGKFFSRSDLDGVFSITVPPGQYTLFIDNPMVNGYSSSYFFSTGQRISEEIYLLPANLSGIKLSDYYSYSLSAKRKGHVAGFPQDFLVRIDRNNDGTAVMRQSFTANDYGGELTFVYNGDQVWWSEGNDYKVFNPEGVQAAIKAMKVNEDLFDFLNETSTDRRFSKTTNRGIEKANGVLCDKTDVSYADFDNWMGNNIFEYTTWTMKEGKLRGMPTRIAGKMSGRDEQYHSYNIQFDISVTDVGKQFKIPEIKK